MPASQPMGTHIDHVILCVDDLDTASSLLESRYGLTSIPGGRHPGHGTANHVVPLGASYLELAAVVDVAEAAESPFGRWVRRRSAGNIAPDGVCLRTDDIDEVAESFGLEVAAMSRRRPDGIELRWRVAGLCRMVLDGLPFFIQWDIPEELHPGRIEDSQTEGTTSIELHLTGQVEQLTTWVDNAEGVSVSAGELGIEGLLIHTTSRTIEI